MNPARDPDPIIATWLDDGPVHLPAETRRAISVALRTQPRARRMAVLRGLPMNSLSRFAAAAAIVLALGAVSVFVLSNRGGGSAASPSVIPTPGPTGAAPSALPSIALASPSPLASPAGWVIYSSDRYGFDIGHPVDWTVQTSIRAWTFEADAKNVMSAAQEAFVAPARNVRVSAWSVPLGSGRTIGSWADLEPWVKDYCQRSANMPCDGIHDRAVQMCNEHRDCHPAVIVPFQDDVQAFFTGGNYGDNMVVVAVWWGDAAPEVAEYGGARRLLESFISTMGVFPPTGPDNHP